MLPWCSCDFAFALPGPCDPECSDDGCEGPSPQQCVTCLHFFLKFKNNTRLAWSHSIEWSRETQNSLYSICVYCCRSAYGSRILRMQTIIMCLLFISQKTKKCHWPWFSHYGGENLSPASHSCREWHLLSSVCFGPCLSNRTCVSECPRGFWGDRRRCKRCFSSCVSCTGSRSDQCTSCIPGHYLTEGTNTCTAHCGDGYYLDHGLPFLISECFVIFVCNYTERDRRNILERTFKGSIVWNQLHMSPLMNSQLM